MRGRPVRRNAPAKPVPIRFPRLESDAGRSRRGARRPATHAASACRNPTTLTVGRRRQGRSRAREYTFATTVPARAVPKRPRPTKTPTSRALEISSCLPTVRSNKFCPGKWTVRRPRLVHTGRMTNTGRFAPPPRRLHLGNLHRDPRGVGAHDRAGISSCVRRTSTENARGPPGVRSRTRRRSASTDGEPLLIQTRPSARGRLWHRWPRVAIFELLHSAVTSARSPPAPHVPPGHYPMCLSLARIRARREARTGRT